MSTPRFNPTEASAHGQKRTFTGGAVRRLQNPALLDRGLLCQSQKDVGVPGAVQVQVRVLLDVWSRILFYLNR